MTGKIRQWRLTAFGQPLELHERAVPILAPDEALVRVAGCGLCHTDLAFLHEGVRTRHALPLVLGHEISGIVEQAGAGCADLVGRAVVVPAVLPCEDCAACRRGRGSICQRQVFPGNDIDGGFASHVIVPARGLCPVPPGGNADVDLAGLAVLADAISTPYQAVVRSGLGPGDLAVFIGVGGVGAFGVQIARALGASVVAIDIDAERLRQVEKHGAALTLDATRLDARGLKKAIREHARGNALPETEWCLFECSGSVAGQETAFGLLVHGAWLGIIGYTPKPASVPVSHLMAFDAIAQGNWGCLPRYYPEALELVRSGAVLVAPFIEKRGLSAINRTLEEARQGQLRRRVVFAPDLAGESA